MKARNIPTAITAFVLGACATAAVQSTASTKPEPAASMEGVITKLADAKVQASPPKTATITHLALGKSAYLGKLSMNPNAKVPTHRDSTEEYIHILEGGGSITIEGKTTAVEAGDTIYMPANVEVHFENGDAQLVAIQVFAGPEPSKKYEKWIDL
jgi:quercetin dioxygenase-like cupin family protein